MALKLFAILLLPVIYAKIQIEVIASENEGERQLDASGSVTDFISDYERQSFRIDDNNLKDGVTKHFGARPDNVFVRSSTPWGDLYQTYNWQEVTRTLIPQKTQILEAASEQYTVLHTTYVNNTTQEINFTAAMRQNVENRISSVWRKDGELTVDQEIAYDIDTITRVVGNTSFSYTSKWGEPVSKSETVTVGHEENLSIPVQPNSSATAVLRATLSTMKIQIDYEASLSGDTVVNYSKTFKDHFFWAFRVNNVINAAGLNPILQSTEQIDLSYYSDYVVSITYD